MSIPTLKAVLLPQHLKGDGSYNVKIRLTHNRKIKYLPTTEYARKGDYTKDLQIKNVSLMKRLSTLMEKMQEKISELGIFNVASMDVHQLAERIQIKMVDAEDFTLDFFEWADTVIAGKKKYSGCNYKTAINSFKRFLGKERMDIKEVTSSLMQSFEKYLVDKHGKNARAVSLYTSSIASIHGEARKRFNNYELEQEFIKNPFAYYKPPKQKPAKKFAIPKEDIQKLIDVRSSLTGLYKQAVDIFLLSFCTMGSNVPDLYEALIDDDIIYYNRMKTRERRYDNAEMHIRLEPIAKCVIDDLIEPKGERAFKLYRQYTAYKSIADKGNDRLKEIAKLVGIKPFSMKAARASWSSIAFSIGIPKSLINDCLCHVDPDMAVTDIYIKKDWSILWDANRKVLGQFDWK